MRQEAEMLREMTEKPSSIQQEISEGEKRLQEILVAQRRGGVVASDGESFRGEDWVDGDSVSDQELLDQMMMLEGGLGDFLTAQQQQEDDMATVEDDIAVEKMMRSLY